MKKAALAAAALAAGAALAGPGYCAGIETSVSSTTRRMLQDLETLERAGDSQEGAKLSRSLFDLDSASRLSVSRPVVVSAQNIRALSPQPNRPGFQTMHIGRGGAFRGYPGYYTGHPGQYPGRPGHYPGLPGRYPGAHPGLPGHYPGYPGYYPGHPGHHPGMPYHPIPRPPTLGERFMSWLNNVEAAVNNFRDALAERIAPDYPYPTRYIQTWTPWGRVDQPVYRYRSGPYDIPFGWMAPGSYLAYLYGTGRFGNIGGVTRYVPGYGWVPPFGWRPNYSYDPKLGLVETFE